MKAQTVTTGRTKIFIVQAFGRASVDVVDIEQPRQAPNLEAALALGEHLAETRAGVVVFSRDMDYAMGEYGDPEVVASHGDVPLDVTQLWEA